MNNETKLSNYLRTNKPIKLQFGKFARELKLSKSEMLKAWNALNRKDRLIVFSNYVLECLSDGQELPKELSPANQDARDGFYQRLSEQTGIVKHNLLYVYAKHFNLSAFEYEPHRYIGE